MLKKELEDKVDQLVSDLAEERKSRRNADDLLTTTTTERNSARVLVKEYESKIALLRTSMETLAAIKFPSYSLREQGMFNSNGIPMTDQEMMEYMENIPEFFLALRHMYALLELGKSSGDVYSLYPR